VPWQCHYLQKETDIRIQRRKTDGNKGDYERERERERERGGERMKRGKRGNTAKKSDHDEILFFARKTRTCRRCLFHALSSIQNL